MKVLRENNKYCIDINTLHMERVGGLPLDLERTEDSVKITLYGIEKLVKLDWLANLAKYDIWLPKHSLERVFDIKFNLCKLPSSKTEYITLVTTDNPIYLDRLRKYQLCLRYSRYALDKDGILYSIINNTRVKTRIKDYVRVYIYDQTISGYTEVLLHRIVATNMVKNHDPSIYNIVNHIDGNKSNYHPSNLEWVTHTENVNHALETGLRSDNYKVLTRNIDTGEIAEHVSVTLASEHIGRARINTAHTPLKSGYVWNGNNGRFELKLADDTSPWVYVNEDAADTIRRTVKYHVIYRNGEQRVFYGIMSLIGEYLGTLGRLSSAEAISRIMERFPTIIKIDKVDTSNKEQMYQARNPITKEEYVASSNKALADLIGLSKSSVTKAVSKKDASITYNGWQIRAMSDDPWPEETVEPKNTAKKYTVTNQRDNSTTIANSIRHLSTIINVDRHTIAYNLNDDKPVIINKYIITPF